MHANDASMHANTGMHAYVEVASTAAVANIGKSMTMNRHAYLMKQHLLLLLRKIGKPRYVRTWYAPRTAFDSVTAGAPEIK